MNSRRLILVLVLATGLALISALMLSLEDITAQAQEATHTLQALPAGNSLTRLTQAATIEEMSVQQTFTPTWATERVDAAKSFGTMGDRSLALDSGDHPHIAYGTDHLYYAWHDGSAWQRITVDPAWGVGWYASIALDGNDAAHLSYYDDINGDLKYAYVDGGQRRIETVDSDGQVGKYTSIAVGEDNLPHIAYWDVSSRTLMYARHDGNTWHFDEVDSGLDSYAVSLALDRSGHPHIGYYRYNWPGPAEAAYAHWTGSNWVTETVDSGSSVGQYASLALDTDDVPHLSYLDGGDETLVYAHLSGTLWLTRAIDSSVGPWFVASSIVVSSTDRPRVAYNNSNTGDVMYAAWNGTSWDIEQVDGSERLYFASLAQDGMGNVHMSYTGADSDDLFYNHWTGSDWDKGTVDYGGDLGRNASLALAATAPYTPHISYTGGSVRHAYYNGTHWVTDTVDTIYNWTGTSIALVPTAPYTPQIAYYDDDDESLKYARWTGSDWSIWLVDGVGSQHWGVGLTLAPTPPYTPHVAYISYGDLKYAYWTGSSWDSTTVDTRDDWFWPLGSPYVALDPTPPYTPFISYHDTYLGGVRFAQIVAGNWVTETVAFAKQGSAWPSLAVDSSGNPHIAYDEWSNADLKYARWTGSDWEFERVDRSGQPSLTLDRDDQPHIAYYVAGDLFYAYREGSNWMTETVDTLGDVGNFVSLALDGEDRSRIAYYDTSNRDLKFAWQTRTDVIPTTGGTVGAYGSATFEFPPGAVTDTVVLTYTVLQPSASQPNVGVFFDISAVFASSGQSAHLAPGQTYTVTTYYDEANVPPGFDESDLALYYWDDASSEWVKEPTSVVDPVKDTITATPSHFSVWAGLFEDRFVSIEKSVTPQGQVEYGDELTYTLVISADRGAQVGIYDRLEGTAFVRFTLPDAGIMHTNGVVTGTLTVTPTNQVTVSFVAQVGVPDTVGITVTVVNSACVYPVGGTLDDCVWSSEVTNSAFQPYSIYLPLTLRNH
jgi:hypothetical protein